MKHLKVTRQSYLLVILLILLVSGGRAAKAVTLLSCGSWNVVTSPNRALEDSLYGVAAVPGTGQFWAVGKYDDNGFFQPLIERWNGTHWRIVSSPNPRKSDEYLGAVAAVSANDVWAVGQNGNIEGAGLTLIEHWNGSHWSIVKSPNPTPYSHLNAVAAIATNDVWAVGYFLNNRGGQQTLVEHWDGTSWGVVASLNKGQDTILNGITAISANDVWAVGNFYNGKRPPMQTLVEHWDGTSWSIVASPSVGKGRFDENYLTGVAAVSANDVWAVGSYYLQGGMQTSKRPNMANDVWAVGHDHSSRHGYQTLTEHWDGIRWSLVKSPEPGGPGGNPILSSVATVSASDAWAVGYYINPNAAYLTLIIHWDGSKWSLVASPSPGGMLNGDFSVLSGVAAASTHNVQAVGYYQTGAFSPTVTLAESYC